MRRWVMENNFTTFATLCVAIACLFILILHGAAPK